MHGVGSLIIHKREGVKALFQVSSFSLMPVLRAALHRHHARPASCASAPPAPLFPPTQAMPSRTLKEAYPSLISSVVKRVHDHKLQTNQLAFLFMLPGR